MNHVFEKGGSHFVIRILFDIIYEGWGGLDKGHSKPYCVRHYGGRERFGGAFCCGGTFQEIHRS